MSVCVSFTTAEHPCVSYICRSIFYISTKHKNVTYLLNVNKYEPYYIYTSLKVDQKSGDFRIELVFKLNKFTHPLYG